MKNKQRLSGGHTNDTFKIQDKKINYFLKEKKFDSFNHRIDYRLLKDFSFVPKFIEIKDQENISEFIEGKYPQANNDNLIKIAKIMSELHLSKIKFPESNLIARLNKYYDMVSHRHDLIPAIKDNYELVKKLISHFNYSSPLHNDPWINNFIENKDGKIYLVDWEYATMGDKHFDLAYFIDGSQLNKKQEQIFLKAYKDYTQCNLEEAKLIVNYLTLLWLHRFDKMPYSDKQVIKNIEDAIICIRK